MKFSYSAIWDDALRMLRAGKAVLLPVAGAFFFLPTLLFGYLAPLPPAADQLMNYASDNMIWLLLVLTLAFIGSLAILVLVLDGDRPTVGAAIGAAFALLWVYFSAAFLAYLLVLVGLFFLLVPGLYLAGRFSMLGPVVVAETKRGTIATLRRTWEMTRGRGWAILGLLLLVYVGLYVAQLAVTFVLGSILLLIDRVGDGGPGIGAFLTIVLSALLGAVLSTIMAVLTAAIYRGLAAEKSVERVFD